LGIHNSLYFEWLGMAHPASVEPAETE